MKIDRNEEVEEGRSRSGVVAGLFAAWILSCEFEALGTRQPPPAAGVKKPEFEGGIPSAICACVSPPAVWFATFGTVDEARFRTYEQLLGNLYAQRLWKFCPHPEERTEYEYIT